MHNDFRRRQLRNMPEDHYQTGGNRKTDFANHNFGITSSENIETQSKVNSCLPSQLRSSFAHSDNQLRLMPNPRALLSKKDLVITSKQCNPVSWKEEVQSPKDSIQQMVSVPKIILHSEPVSFEPRKHYPVKIVPINQNVMLSFDP